MKKTFSKFLATAAAVSMLASVSTVVNADVSFTTKECEHGVIITGTNVANGDEIETITIPDKIDGKTVVGVADFAFADLDSLTEIWAGHTLTLEHTGNAAFVTKQSLSDYIKSELGAGVTRESALEYIADLVYGDKDWTAEELAEVEAKINAKAALAGVEFTEEDMTEDGFFEAVAVMLKNEEAMNLAGSTADSLAIWETTITYNHTTLVVLSGTEMDEYFSAKEETLGMNVEVNGVVTSPGDANKDGEVTVRDAAAIAAALAKGAVKDLPGNGDYNGDSEVTVRDAAAIARDLAKGIL